MSSGSPLALHVLGAVDLRYPDGRTVQSVLANPRRVAFLVYVALGTRDGWVQRESLASMFWPEAATSRGRSSLRGTIHFLRQRLGADVLEGTGPLIRVPAHALDCDAIRLLEASEAGDHGAALELYAGSFLDGFHISGAPDFEAWQASTRRQLHLAAVRSALSAADEALQDRNTEAVVAYLRRAVELEPESEGAVRRLLRTLHAAGDRAGALATFDAWASSLHHALEMDPSAETLALVESIRLGGPPEEGTAPPLRREAVALSPPDDDPAAPKAPEASTTLAEPATHGPRALLGILAGPIVAVLLLVAGWLYLTSAPTHPAGAVPSGADNTVAVFPFEAVGNQDTPLAPAMPFLLAQALSLSKVRVLDPSAVRDRWMARINEDPVSTARALGASRLITGTVRYSGDRVFLDAEIRSTAGSGHDSNSATVEGTVDDLSDLTARLVRGLAPDLPLTSGSMPAALTSDVRALAPFVAGEELFRAGRYAAADSAYARAVALDGTFALAFYKRSVAADWLGQADTARDAADRALTNSYRLSLHARRLLDAWRAYLWGSTGDALDAYGRLAAAGPADTETWLRLGELRFHWGAGFGVPPEAADTAFVEAMRLSAGNPSAALHRSRLASRRGDQALAAALSAEIQGPGTTEAERIELAIREALVSGGAAPRDAIAALASSAANVEWNVLSEVATSLADPGPVVDFIRHLPPSADLAHTLHRAWLAARILAGRGRYAEAGAVLDSVASRAPTRVLELKAALALARLSPPPDSVARRFADALWVAPGDAGEASARGMAAAGIYDARRVLLAGMFERTARRLSLDTVRTRLADVPGRFSDPYRLVLLAWDSFLQDDPAGTLAGLRAPAVDADGLRPGPLSYPLAMARWMRAEALLQLGRDQEALAWYRGFPEPNGSDLMFLGGARLREGQILERSSQRREAARAYRSALTIWEGADPEVQPLVEEARRGLTRVTR